MYGLSGDLGWNDDSDQPDGGRDGVLLFLATGAYFASLWLVSGLPPLAAVAIRRWRPRSA
jgi:hypothetical protein